MGKCVNMCFDKWDYVGCVGIEINIYDTGIKWTCHGRWGHFSLISNNLSITKYKSELFVKLTFQAFILKGEITKRCFV